MGRKSLDDSKVCSVRRLVEHKTLVAIFLFFICFGLYAPSLRNGFVWDDVYYIKHKPYLFRASNVNSGTFLSIKEKREFSHYRPMLFISLVVDHELWGRSTFGFHLINVILYSISTILFYLLALFVLEEFRVDGKETKAFLSSLFVPFIPHTLNRSRGSQEEWLFNTPCGKEDKGSKMRVGILGFSYVYRICFLQ